MYIEHGKTNPKAPAGRHVYSNAESPHSPSPRGATCGNLPIITQITLFWRDSAQCSLRQKHESPDHITVT